MSKNLALKISPLAKTDLESIFEYIAVDLCNRSAAFDQVAAFKKAFDRICDFPESYPLVENEYVKDKNLRKIVVNNYVAFYRVTEDEAVIVRVLYGMRNYQSIL